MKYRFKSERQFRSFDLHKDEDIWENVCYLLEIHLKLTKTYLKAWTLPDKVKLKRVDTVSNDAVLCLARLPCRRKQHIPIQIQQERIRKEATDILKIVPDLTEEQKLELIMQQSIVLVPKPKPIFHSQYECHYCGATGKHLVDKCPIKKTRPHFIPMYKRKYPNGIPKISLRPAQTDDEIDIAFINAAGDFVVRC